MNVRRELVMLALLAWCGGLLALRIAYSHSGAFLFLIWNLFLAAIPYVMSIVMVELHRRGIHGFIVWMCGVVWLLFLPNAPYVLTDFIHLGHRPPVPLWFDLLLLASASGAGLLLGYGSMMIVHRIADQRFGKTLAWLMATGVIFLSAFGIYLGRFLRLNSWEAFTDPVPLFGEIIRELSDPFGNPKTFAVTGLFGIALTLGYVALHVLAESVAEEEERGA